MSTIKSAPDSFRPSCTARLDNFAAAIQKAVMESTRQKSTLSRVAAVAALVLFAAATVWINCQVKVNVQGGKHGGSVSTMGNVKVGAPAPDFSLLDLSNQTVTLSSYLGKKVVLLDFWATWCSPCRMEMVELQSLQDKLKGTDFEILSLNQQESADPVRQFIQRKKYGFHVLLDDGAAGDKYGVRAIPTLVLVDKSGVIRWLQVGYTGESADLEQQIRRLLKK